MGRSLKKGPFVDEHLMKKVEAQANDEKKKLLKLGHVVQRSSQVSLVTLLQFMTDVNTYLFTSKKTW
ncbi:30S ribosomal protein S19 [Streptococcus pneumoniae GA16833]|nr:30S ribosomal protein S19 [Streptococcus pneumoniae GA16833]